MLRALISKRGQRKCWDRNRAVLIKGVETNLFGEAFDTKTTGPTSQKLIKFHINKYSNRS